MVRDADIGAGFGVNPQRAAAAVAAAAVSLGFHVGLLYFMPDVRVRLGPVYTTRLPPPEVEVPPVRLEGIELDPPEERPPRLKPEHLSEASRDQTVPEGLVREPDRALIAPPAAAAAALAGETGGLAKPDDPPTPSTWEPRQEVVMIEKARVEEALRGYERRRVPRIERVRRAPDVVQSVTREQVGRFGRLAGGGLSGGRPGLASIEGAAAAGSLEETELDVSRAGVEQAEELFREEREEITDLKPIEKLLRASLATYRPVLRDRAHGYFELRIERLGEEVLPVTPKDLLLVQDCSASMTEQRLYFCREGLRQCIASLGAGDRFNVVGFRDRAEWCFPDWTENTPEARDRAGSFVDAMRAGGNTDIFNSLVALRQLKRVEGRPVVALLITDGLPTSGLVVGSDIIKQFSRVNQGQISVFAVGTMSKANRYLLDLLSYCNRGASSVVTKGRWEIPEAMAGLARQVSRPLLSDVGFQFTGDACEVYPVQTENLYLDRPLVLYGRYPRDLERVVFQVVGRAVDVSCDMVFDLPFRESEGGRDPDIRHDWASQKVYHLIGRYARSPDEALRREIEATADRYDVAIPHRRSF